MQAIILAGGKGTRLQPYTMVFPKPMLPVGGLPIIATIVRQLAHFGFDDLVISLGHLGDYIRMYFGDPANVPPGVRIRYYVEEQPLGTAGPLSIIGDLAEDFLVINGDILSTIDYADFFRVHRERGADLSVAVGVKEVKMSLGILDLDPEGRITSFREKPTFKFYDNMGVYVYNRGVMPTIQPNRRLDVNDLVATLLRDGKKVYGYLSKDHYYWIDIGQHGDYEKANEEFEKNKNAFLHVGEDGK